MSKTVSKFALAAGIALATAFTLSCFPEGGDEGGSQDGGNLFSYCLVSGQCLGGSFTSKECSDLGGLPSNICIAGVSSSSSPGEGGVPTPAKTPFTDSHDGKTYNKVTIGTQVWMAENLDYAVEGSRCYGEGAQVITDLICADAGEYLPPNCTLITKTLSPDEVQANCATYGRLYNWATALTACPSGWRLPSNYDWDVLMNYVGGSSTAGNHLKATSGWNWNDYYNISSNGTDDYGFSALPGGSGYPAGSLGLSDGSFGDVGGFGGWWSASENYGSNAYRLQMYRYEDAYRSYSDKSYLYSVRCLQNSGISPSSSSVVPSSSSALPSSSSVAPSSSSVVPSSSSALPSSSSVAPSSSSVEPSSSSALPSSSSRSSLPIDSDSGHCKSGGRLLFCQYENGCYELNTDYTDGEGCMAPNCTCARVVANCVNGGSVYTGVTGIDESNGWGTGVNCATNGGTWTGYGKEPQ